MLTTLPVTSCKEALQVLKCEIGEIARRTAERAHGHRQRRLAMPLGRETPELPAEAMFAEIGVLRDFATNRKLSEPLDLGTATMAMLGVTSTASMTARPVTR